MGGNHSRDNQRNSQPHQHVDPRHNTDVSTKGHLRSAEAIVTVSSQNLKVLMDARYNQALRVVHGTYNCSGTTLNSDVYSRRPQC